MRAALLVAAGLLLTGSTRAMMLPRDPASVAAAVAEAVAADYDSDSAATGVNWPVDEPPPARLTKEKETRLLRILLLRMIQERSQHQQDEHNTAIDAAIEGAGPLLEVADIAGAASRVGDTEHPPPHAPDDKRNSFRALVPTLCHFKICNMGRKRNSPPEAGAAAWPSL